MKYKIPLAEALIDELFPFWKAIFDEEMPGFGRAVLLGAEERENRSTLYLQRAGETLAGTCFLMQSVHLPALAGLGDVATNPQMRGQGIATTLCTQALTDFHAAGGQALFLGTVNPAAARIYHRLGWRKLAGANVMANITSGAAPEEFLVDYFRRPGDVTVGIAGPDVRVPMIPLILTPHDSLLLDANVGLYSCRYRSQNSCMGLYPRYADGLRPHQGAFFAARTTDGRVVGLATARPDGADGCQVDGFVHRRFATAWPELMAVTCAWAKAQGATTLAAIIMAEDEEKQALFAAIGFTHAGSGAAFSINGQTVGTFRMQATG